MNPIQLEKFDDFIVQLFISPFERSDNCLLILTSGHIFIGITKHNSSHVNWDIFKRIPLNIRAYSVTLSDKSQTHILPYNIILAYANKEGVYVISISDNNVVEQKILSGDNEVNSICYSPNGDCLSFCGFDKKCHVLIYECDSLSDSDSIITDAVSEGSYYKCSTNLSSPGQLVKWHTTLSNFLVCLEINGNIRFLSSYTDKEEREIYKVDFIINLSGILHEPVYDFDFISNTIKKELIQLIVACNNGLYTVTTKTPITSLEKVPISHKIFTKIAMAKSLGKGTILATIHDHSKQLLITDLNGSNKMQCLNSTNCIDLGWSRNMNILYATTYDKLNCYVFH